MDIQHAAVVWRLLFGHISALKNQKWISCTCYRPEDMHLPYRGTSRMGLRGLFRQVRGRGGASPRAWKRIVPPANQGIEPPRFYPTH